MRSLISIVMVLCQLMAFGHKTDSNLDQALQSLGSGQYEDAFNFLKKSAATNNVQSQFYLAQFYEYGIGVDPNPEEAFLMYRRAAERGLLQAMYELSRCYSQGVGVASNESRANEWYTRYNNKSGNSKPQEIIDIVAMYNESLSNPQLITQTNSKTKDKPQAADSKSKTVSGKSSQQIERKVLTPVLSATDNHTPPEFNSDVDINIPKLNKNNENSFAFIFANENYQDVSNVPFAIRDGEVFSKYCNLALGIPESNIHLVKDGTLNNLKRELNLMSKIAEAYNGEANFLIYYAGHGFPDEKSLNAYLLPVDGFTDDITTCYSLNDLYDFIGSLPSLRNIIFLDACFSGSQRGEGMLANARGVKLKSKAGLPTGNTLVLTSAEGDETAYPLEEEQHGLFTYFLLKKLKEGKGNVTMGDLVNYLKENVTKKSLVVNGRRQSPSVSASDKVINEWNDWKLISTK